MNTFLFITFYLAMLTVTNAGYYGPSAKVVQGPHDSTSFINPAPDPNGHHHTHPKGDYQGHVVPVPYLDQEAYYIPYAGERSQHRAPAPAHYQVPVTRSHPQVVGHNHPEVVHQAIENQYRPPYVRNLYGNHRTYEA